MPLRAAAKPPRQPTRPAPPIQTQLGSFPERRRIISPAGPACPHSSPLSAGARETLAWQLASPRCLPYAVLPAATIACRLLRSARVLLAAEAFPASEFVRASRNFPETPAAPAHRSCP